MKKVLYISNIEVPYRVKFFNMLAEKCDLTVLYERKKSKNRDAKWSKSEKEQYNIIFLNGIKIKNEYALDLNILKYVFSKKYDIVIFGCYNSPLQMIAIVLMKILGKKYFLNFDGEVFAYGSGIKNSIKRYFIRGAEKYLVAGEKSAQTIMNISHSDNVYPYYFSSLTEQELIDNSKQINHNTNNKVLVVGQYYDYKGLDIALNAAKLNQTICYRFIGSGNRSKLLKNKVQEMGLKNVEIIPFLDKRELYKEYQNCKCLLLTSRQECWGLVINEAMSFGCPILASKYSGAAIELLDEQHLIDINDINHIVNKIESLDNLSNKQDYKEALIKKCSNYSIEKSVTFTLKAIG